MNVLDVNAILMLLYCDLLAALGYIYIYILDKWKGFMPCVGHMLCLKVRCMLVCVSLE